MAEGISIIIPTLNGGGVFRSCLRAVEEQRSRHRVQLILAASGSTDGTVEEAEKGGAEVIRIERGDFHHSRTRNQALKSAVYDRVVFLVQDAVPVSSDWLDILSDALKGDGVVAAYGRHLPHDNADPFAWFETTSHGEFLGDRVLIQALGSEESLARMPYSRAARLTRCDNVCAIYRRELLAEFPFPDVSFGEDMAWAKAVMLRGFKIKYDPDIQVKHSHNRGPDYRFRRALVANLTTAGILGRVRQDLSFLTCRDLEWADGILEEQRARAAGRIKKRAGRQRPSPLWSILARSEGLLSLLGGAAGKLATAGGRKQWRYSFPRLAEAKINFVMGRVNRAFPRATGQELIDCTKQMIGSMRGTLYGETAASYRLKGPLPPDLERVILPFLEGV